VISSACSEFAALAVTSTVCFSPDMSTKSTAVTAPPASPIAVVTRPSAP
jgi:hypothetical protein